MPVRASAARPLATILLATSALAAHAASIAAQESPTVARFDLGTSPVELSGPARPGVFVSAVGRRSVAMGTEDGRFELWSWPVKWLHDLELSFRVPKYSEPLPGRTLARRTVTRPEGVTIEYAYEQFTVKQHVFVPLDLPAVVMLLEVDAVRPLEILVRFTPDIHLAWPAGLGGQYLVWNQPARAFLFSESRRRINAFLGSPAVTQASDVPAHMLAGSPPQLVLGVGDSANRYAPPRLGEPPGRGVNLNVAYIPIVLAGGDMPRDSALALYRRLVAPGAAEREWKRRVAHADSIRTARLSISSPDTLLDRAVEWAKLNLDDAMACNPELGCGLVAGYGLSGAASDRPGFGWYFGGDASINAIGMTGAGQRELVRDGVLRFFAKYQRADGKIPHEISHGAARLPWFTDYGYTFFHGDTTPFWVLAFGEYWKQTADTALVRELWPQLSKAYEWSRSTDRDGDGLMENPAAGAGAIEVGDLGIGILSDVYMSGVWVAALDRFARMARAMGETPLADSAEAIGKKARQTMESRLWLESRGQYAFALLQDGTVNDNLTSWPATAMSFDVFDRGRGSQMAARLASSAISTDWGARPLAATSRLFDPLHYNNGAVWPFVTGWVALGQYRYHNAHAGKQMLDAIARTTFDESRGRNPEVISGRLYKPLDTSVPQQFFATSMILTPLIRGLLGIDVDAPARRLTIAPHLPIDWDSLRVRNVAVGESIVDLAFRRSATGISLDLVRRGADGSPIELVFSPALPLGARTRAERDETPGDVHATVRGTLGDRLTLEVPYTGGWSIVPPTMRPAIGDRSTAPRVIGERLHAAGGSETYSVELEGLAGRSYPFELVAPLPSPAIRADGAIPHCETSDVVARRETSAGRAAGAPALEAGLLEFRVTFPERGANADGFTRCLLTFARDAESRR